HTGSDGSYRLAGLPGGAVALRASAGNRRATTTLQLAAAERARWDPVLVADPHLLGVVLGPDGLPRPGLTIAFARPPQPPLPAAQTDPQGRFALQVQGDESVQVAVQQDDVDLVLIDDVHPGGPDLEIHLGASDLPSARLRLRVVDERGRPVAAKVA